MKKLMVLGGAKAQVPLIEAAKKEGYYVVLCDWTSTNPGIPLADKHYQVSTLDLEAVLKVARDEKIDGVVSNSEPAMHNVAVIAEKLGLIGNPVRAVDILDSKYDFRQLQRECGLYAPMSCEIENSEQLHLALKKLEYPVILKPSENSGSRGITVLSEENAAVAEHAFETCQAFSRNKRVTIEEYVRMPSRYNVGGDVFVCNGTILWEGLATCIREKDRTTIPAGKAWPIYESDQHVEKIKDSLGKLFQASGIRHGAYNVEGYFTEKDDFFVIEINTRQGGNDIPKLINDHCGIDMYRLLVTTAVGDNTYFNEVLRKKHERNCVLNFVVLPKEEGAFRGIHISTEIGAYVYRVSETVPIGKRVRKALDATDAVGMVRLRFPNQKTQWKFVEELSSLISAEVSK